MNIFATLEAAPDMKEKILKYDFPTSNLYPGNKYPKSRALNYIVDNASRHRPSIITLKNMMTLVVTCKINDVWFVVVQQNGTDLESNLDAYILQNREQFYEDLAREILQDHGCSGDIDESADCVRCFDCGAMLAVL